WPACAGATQIATAIPAKTMLGNDVIELAVELGAIAALVALGRTQLSVPSTAAAFGYARRGKLRTSLIAGGFLVPFVGFAAFMSPAMQQRMFEAAAQKRTSSVNTAPLADDALRVAVCGSSAPLPSANRAKACVAVFAGGKFYVVDVGPESVENLVIS